MRSFGLLILILAMASPTTMASQQKQYRYWNSSWTFDDIDLSDLSSKLSVLGIDVPVALRGRANVNLTVGVPWNALQTQKAYRITGKISGTNVNVDTLQLKTLDADVQYANGVLSVPSLVLQQNDGKVTGSMRAQIEPRGDFDGRFKAATFDIRPVASLLSKLDVIPRDVRILGSVGFDVAAKGKVETISDLSSWSGSGTASIRSLRIARGAKSSPPISGTVDRLEAANGSLKVAGFKLRADQQSQLWIRGNAQVPLTANGTASIELAANDFDYGSFVDILSPGANSAVQGKVDLVMKGTGELIDGEPVGYNVDARVASPNLSVLGFELGLIEHSVHLDGQVLTIRRLGNQAPSAYSAIDSLTMRYSLDQQKFRGDSLDAKVFGGTLNGRIQLAREPDGQHVADLTWNDISPSATITLPFADRPTKLTGSTSGSLKWRTLARDISNPARQRAEVKVNLRDVSAMKEKLGDVTADIVINDQSVSVNADGSLLGGELTVRSNATLSDSTSWRALSSKILVGMLRIKRGSIRKLSKLFRIEQKGFDGDWSIDLKTDDTHTAEISFSVRNVTEFGKPLIARATARGTVDETGLEIEEITGGYARGSLSGSGVWKMKGPRLIRLRLAQCDASRMLLPLSKASQHWFAGRASGIATITSNANDRSKQIRIVGHVDLIDGTLFDTPVGNMHSPFRATIMPLTADWALDFHDIQTAVARGRASGQLALHSAIGGQSGFHMDSMFRVIHIDFRDLLAESIGTRAIGHGDLTGVVTLNGRQITSAKDLEGTFRFQLGGTDAGAVPGILSASSFIGAASLAGTRFREGHAVGRISNGIARLEECVLTARSLGFEADGKVDLMSGRMAIDAVLATGNFQGQTSVLRQTLRPRLVDAIGIGTINQVLSDRTVVFRMQGNVRSPIIRLMPGETIQANARSVAIRQLSAALTAGTVLAP